MANTESGGGMGKRYRKARKTTSKRITTVKKRGGRTTGSTVRKNRKPRKR